MDAMGRHVRGVAKKFNEFATQIMKPTTVRDAKLVGNFSRIAVCPGYCDRIGRGRSTRSSLSSAARIRFKCGAGALAAVFDLGVDLRRSAQRKVMSQKRRAGATAHTTRATTLLL